MRHVARFVVALAALVWRALVRFTVVAPCYLWDHRRENNPRLGGEDWCPRCGARWSRW